MASKKRRAVGRVEMLTPSSLPALKRARFEERNGIEEEKVWGSSGLDERMETADTPSGETRSPSPVPSFPFTEPSIADTSMTSASTSRRPKKYICDYQDCGKAFDRPVRLQMHIRSHTNERPYACEEEGCDKTFLRSEHLTRHMKDKHSEEKDYGCTYIISSPDGTTTKCDKSFTTATRLRRHLAAHETKEETRCQEPGCGKMFRKQETLQRHIRQDHLHEKAYSCDHVDVDEAGQPIECNKAFTKVEQLKNHKSREHAEHRYYCEICHPVLDEEVATEEAEADRIAFATYADLQHHIKLAHPPTCHECGKQCESTRALKAHMDIEHTSLSERQQFRCTWPGCERAFTKSGNLKVHVQNVHTKARNFVCGTFDLTGNEKVAGWDFKGCGSAFGTKANLEDHVHTQHLGYRSKVRPCRLKKIKVEEESETQSLMDVDEIAAPGDGVSLLTGFGFQDSRNVACLVSACDVRFARDSNLAQHLELTHGWNIDDINEAIAERDALSGGKFWIGGGEPVDADESLRQQLTDALTHSRHDEYAEQQQPGSYDIRGELRPGSIVPSEQLEKTRRDDHEMMWQCIEGTDGLGGSSMMQAEGGIPIDPALMETNADSY